MGGVALLPYAVRVGTSDGNVTRELHAMSRHYKLRRYSEASAMPEIAYIEFEEMPWPFPNNSFDAVLALRAIGGTRPDELAPVLSQVVRLLRPGGVALLQVEACCLVRRLLPLDGRYVWVGTAHAKVAATSAHPERTAPDPTLIGLGLARTQAVSIAAQGCSKGGYALRSYLIRGAPGYPSDPRIAPGYQFSFSLLIVKDTALSGTQSGHRQKIQRTWEQSMPSIFNEHSRNGIDASTINTLAAQLSNDSTQQRLAAAIVWMKNMCGPL